MPTMKDMWQGNSAAPTYAANRREVLKRAKGACERCGRATKLTVSLLSAITTIQTQLREAGEEASVYVADNGVYSESNMRQLNQAGVRWISRVWETMTEAKALIGQGSGSWQPSEDGTIHWFSRELELPQGRERWVVVYTQTSLQRAQQTLQRQVNKAQIAWEQKCWHLGNRRFACEADARATAERDLKEKPAWLDVRSELVTHPQYAGKGRPGKDASPASQQWQIVATVTVNQQQVAEPSLSQRLLDRGHQCP